MSVGTSLPSTNPVQVSMNGGKLKKIESEGPGERVGVTIRLQLDLAPPTDENTNEFSYVHLVKEKEAKVGS